MAKIQPPGSVVNLNISCDIYCISATSIDGDWLYIKLIDNTQFKIVVNAQKAFWICLGILKQQWGYKEQLAADATNYPIPFNSFCHVIAFVYKHPSSGSTAHAVIADKTNSGFKFYVGQYSIMPYPASDASGWWLAWGIQQWGYVDDASNYSHIVELSFTIAFVTTPYIVDAIMALQKESSSNFFYALPVSVTNTTAKLYYSGYGGGSNNTRGYFWLAIGN